MAAYQLFALMTVGPFVVARGVDHREYELLKLIKDSLVPIRDRFRNRRKDLGAGARLAAGMDVADMDHEADVRIGIDRIDQDRRVFEQKLVRRRDGGIRIGPVAEHSDGNLIVAYGVGGNRRDSAQPRRRQQRRYSKQSFHTPLFELPCQSQSEPAPRFRAGGALARAEPSSRSRAPPRGSGSWSKVHCRGALSGRQRSNVVPWRKRLSLTWSYRTSTTSSGRSGCHSPERSVLQRLGPPGARPVKPDGATSFTRRRVSSGLSRAGRVAVNPTWFNRPASS